MRMYITFSERERRKGKLFLHLKNETFLPNFLTGNRTEPAARMVQCREGILLRAVWRRGIVKVPNGKEEEGERKCNKFIFGKKESEEG